MGLFSCIDPGVLLSNALKRLPLWMCRIGDPAAENKVPLGADKGRRQAEGRHSSAPELVTANLLPPLKRRVRPEAATGQTLSWKHPHGERAAAPIDLFLAEALSRREVGQKGRRLGQQPAGAWIIPIRGGDRHWNPTVGSSSRKPQRSRSSWFPLSRTRIQSLLFGSTQVKNRSIVGLLPSRLV